MKFSDISAALLSIKSCSVVIHNDSGVLYYSNLHQTVRSHIKTVSEASKPSEDEQCIMLKEQLKYILDNMKSLKRGAIGYRDGKKAS